MYRLTNFHRFGSFHVNHPPPPGGQSNGNGCLHNGKTADKHSNNTSLLRSMSFRNNMQATQPVATTHVGGGAKSYKTEATFQPVQPRRIASSSNNNNSVGISSIIFGNDENQENAVRDRKPSGAGSCKAGLSKAVPHTAPVGSGAEKPAWAGTLKPVRKPSNASSASRTAQAQSYVNSLAYQILPSHVVSQAKSHDALNSYSKASNNNQVSSTGSSVNFSSSSGSGSAASSSSSSPNQRSPKLVSNQTSNGNGSSSIQQLHSNSCAMPIAASSPSLVKKRMPVADDADGHLAYLPGDVIMDRYEVVSTLGEGTFGKVAKAKDLQTDSFVALKVIKNIHKYREAARLEINVLRQLNGKEPSAGRNLCVKMFDSFNYYGHMCLTFEVLGESVFDFLKSNSYYPYPLEQVRHIAYQLSHAVLFMHQHKVRFDFVFFVVTLT